MANRIFSDLKALGKGFKVIAGSFAPNGSSAIAATSRKGPGWSVARTSAGLFTITFTDAYIDMVSATASLQLATAADRIVQIGTYDSSARTLQIRVWDISDAAVADVAADANNRINFCVVFRDSLAPPALG